MESLLTYIIQVNLLLGIIYLGYIGLLKGLTFYSLNRVYFLAGGMFAFIYPFMDLKSLFVQRGLDMGGIGEQISFYMTEPEVQQQLTLGRLVEIVFMVGAVLLLLKFVFQLLSLLRIHLNSTSDQWRTYLFRNVLIPIVPFSFLNKIYVNKEQHLDAELKDIFKHEDIHVKGLHSLDILLFEMILVCCWYNPFVWLMRRAIRQNLEYLTDQQVLDKGIDKQTYQYSLLNVSKKGTSVGLSNQFNFKLLKRRIMMMNKKRSSKIELSKYAFLLPVFLLTGAAFTVSKAEGSIENVVEKANETVLPIQMPELDLKSQGTQSVMNLTPAADTVVKAKTTTVDFREIKRSAIDFSKAQKYFVDNKLVSKAEFLTIPEEKLAKYWFSNDSDLIKYRTNSAIDISAGAILANTVEMEQKIVVAQKKFRCVMNGIVQEKTFSVDDIDPNTIASVSVLQGKAAIDRYGEDVGKDGIIEVKLKEGAHIGKDMTKLKGLTIGVEYADDKLIEGKPANVVYVINGKRTDQKTIKELALTPEEIATLSIWKDDEATKRYGEDAKNGVLYMTTKKWAQENPDKVNDKFRFNGQKVKKADNVVTVVGYKKGEGQEGKAVTGVGQVKNENAVDNVVTVFGYKKDEILDEPKLITFKDKSETVSLEAKAIDFSMNKQASQSIGTDFPSVRMRGYNGKIKPLFVVDGKVKVEGGMDKLDPKDIESMEILKNSSATALYGSAGKDGVIIITTRKKAGEIKNSEQVNGKLKEKVDGIIKMEIDKEKARASSIN
ncbi:M56 family metallopeptidase [Sphingobacterium sp.]|uniref:M56 family metallopeptidase n=1 Tax=Sphingobacterium sp. TaxID=341027 RepID=UPI002FDCCE08